jgi:pilus assembly protein Flp/PilA
MTKILNYLNDESGATAAEYALLVALIAAVIIGGASVLGNAINNKFNTVATTISGTGS